VGLLLNGLDDDDDLDGCARSFSELSARLACVGLFNTGAVSLSTRSVVETQGVLGLKEQDMIALSTLTSKIQATMSIQLFNN
jgi:hypothetical protein